jgi:hypothetical protein
LILLLNNTSLIILYGYGAELSTKYSTGEKKAFALALAASFGADNLLCQTNLSASMNHIPICAFLIRLRREWISPSRSSYSHNQFLQGA